MPDVTLATVASAAGVSTATASRILSGTRAGDPRTAARVRQAATQLGYQGNSIARALRRGRTGNIGMVIPSISNPFFTSLVEHVELDLAQRDLNLFLCDARDSPQVEAMRLASLTRGTVDGVLISPCQSTASQAALDLTAAAVPVVQLDRYVEGSQTDRVILDDDQAMRLVVEHLAALDIKNAAFVTSTAGSSSALLRLASVKRWSSHHGINLRPDHVLDGQFSLEWGAEAADKLMRTGALPQAIICGGDLSAIGLITRLAHHGISVPRDVLVTGFDDISLASLTMPTLTTLRQPRQLMAAEAVRLLMARIDQPERPSTVLSLSGSLITRESTRRTVKMS
ncbi:LacI family transcriptional regulator [Kineococcus sp. NBC_00420]|uniref:LacI family DNA-binding transcriptional regulator n=1 Tax=Kineococcus sp. NBC_00420 TaxID=2903564 RepID=UPI002E1C1BAF